ncbi:MAG: AMP-binding protein [Aquabacterium sp.]
MSDTASGVTRAQAIAELTAPGQPYALADVVVRGQARRWFTAAVPSLRALYETTATDAPFLAWGEERWSFAQGLADAARIGHLLVHEAGIVVGDRVAIAMRNYPEWMLAFNAITSIGAVAVAVNALAATDEQVYMLEHSGARVLIADQERLDKLAGALPGLRAWGVRATRLPPGVGDLRADMQRVGPVAMPAADIALDDPAILLYTSGSTGRPKGVLSSHRNVLAALYSWELDKAVGERVSGVTPPPPAAPGTLLAVPLFHVTGLHAVYLSSFRSQRMVAPMYRWDVAAAADLIDREQLTSFVAPAAMTGDLVRFAEQTGRGLPSLMVVGGGGAPRAPEQVRRIDGAFAQAQPGTGWGMTETNAIGTGIGGPEYLERPASSGRSSQVLQLRVVDEAGQLLPAGQRGELQIRGTSMFIGYFGNPQATAASHVDGDWFRTGDVAYLDDEGYLFIVDRIKDLIIRGGENIGCGHVEAALLAHPQVHEAAVYAVPDERLGEEVGATLQADPALTEDALRQHLGGLLARHEVPRYLRLLHEPLPRTGSGKILKRELRLQALAALGIG